ncbi:MAG: T9SS type A sorting domain-containing protein, partial [Bacteroidetes bacterium]|nr:T9SS type A sorting domain-containing protein [Bacteroidota bacterium]
NGKNYRPDQEEGEEGRDRREAWIELLHKTAPGTNWREIDLQNLRQLQEMRPRSGNRSLEYFADSTLVGEWSERGSNNLAGSLRTVDYDPSSDKIYGISDGGCLWKGELDGGNWTILNDDIRLHPDLLKVLPSDTGGVRIVASLGKRLRYSDDEGQTWANSVFSPNFYDDWGRPMELLALADSAQTLYYLVLTWDSAPWEARVWLYRSTNGGANFTRIKNFGHGADYKISMWQPFQSNEVYVLDHSEKLYAVQADSVPLLHDISTLPPGADLVLTGQKNGATLTFYALADNQNVFKSTDGGQVWELQGTTPESAWSVGMMCSPFDPDKLFMGGVNCHSSFDGGVNWGPVNEWWEYYGNLDLLHADIMDLKAFQKTDGTPFMLVANHGGLHISYDHLETTENIGLSGLNISQYYDVLTNPLHPNYIYTGSQDQGWQWTTGALGDGPLNFTQQWSGDYGMMQLTNNYESFWTQYPGGIMDFYRYALTLPNPWPDSEWHLEGDDKPAVGWIVPTATTAYPDGNSVFIGGGKVGGGPGSYLILLSASTSPPYAISAYQFDYDFKQNSNSGSGLISAIEQSPADPDRIFVTTSDGTFFYSHDAGSTWTKSAGFSGPTTDWIYTADILASRTDPNVLWLSGSGYSNPPVFKSVNGGQTFVQMSNGLPPTLIQELVANPDETMLFGASAIGPFVYVVAENKWYPMVGEQTPLQWYTCVEYVENEDIVRFGTMGRGIWDFKISELPPSATGEVSSGFSAKIYPNPAAKGDVLKIKTNTPETCDFLLTDLSGRALRRQPILQNGEVPAGTLASGVYFYRFSKNGKTLSAGKLVVN